MLSRNEIEKLLSAELDAAKRRNSLAGDNFRSVMNDDHRDTLAGLHKALKRFNGFKVLGIIPEDLKNRETRS
jgi:hypothetical protein